MLSQILIGALVIFGCIVLQAAMLAAGFVHLRRSKSLRRPQVSIFRTSILVGAAALWLMAVHAVSILAWAIAFRWLDIFGDWDTSVYFAAVAFTTLGFGDVIPPTQWRQLAGLCAAHGLLVFGVSSAALVEVFRLSFEPPSR
ncbi:MAG: ion channel [Pseudomonadota bacterium]